MNVTVVGTGYVGLVVGACLADVGNDVICVDHDPAKVEMLKAGGIPIYEPGLDAIVARNIRDSRLSFTTEPAQAIKDAEIIFIAVGTPPGEDGSADLQYVLAVAETIAEHMQEEKIVICKSTVPVGTCDKVRELIQSKSAHNVHVVSNPEFLKEGSAVRDFQSPDRVIIGSDDERASRKVGNLYAPFMRRSNRILHMNVRSAEMTKYASNSMLATKISFMNEIANLCDAVGADVEMVRQGMSMDERIGPHFIFPGVGFGGSCFPKDIRALSYLGDQVGRPTPLVKAVEQVNDQQKTRLVDVANGFYQGELEGKHFAVWGLSFKPKTDDIREAPALISIRALVGAGATITAFDPIAAENASAELADLGESVSYVENQYDALDNADGLFIFTEWNEFRSPNFKQIAKLLNQPVIFDGRNLYDLQDLKERGIKYFCIGRATHQDRW